MRYAAITSFAAVIGCAVLVAARAPMAGVSRPARSGAAIYRDACASCHGAAGTGASRSQIGFDVPMPDLTDCNFATREMKADWATIVREGGPARGFNEIMPAFGDALDEGEIERVVGYAKHFCDDDAWPQGEMNLPRAILTEKAFPEDELLLSMSVTTRRPVETTGKLILERRVGPRSQVEAIIPFGARKRDPATENRTGWAGGVGDIAFGAKHVLFWSGRTGSIMSLGGEIALPTGNRADGFGKGTLLFEPFLLFGQIIPHVGFIQLQGGAELPYSKENAGNEAYGRLALGRMINLGRRGGPALSPMVEIVGMGELGEGTKIDWDAAPQMQLTLSHRRHFRINGGYLVPLTSRDVRPSAVLFYVLWDWFDGGLSDGW
jgi:mono/diheme cytochrome c family protein